MQQGEERERCLGWRLATVPIGAIVGSGFGLILFYFGPGVVGSDHGAIYQRTRRQFRNAGAALGVAVGIYQAFTQECPRRRRIYGS